MNNLKIEYVPISELNAYVNNAKEHPAEQVEQIKKSILEFGMNDPIAVWKDNVIIEGHGRLLACAELGEDYSVVPIIRLDYLTDEQRRAYALVHNKLTMNSDFNLDLLSVELESLTSVNMLDFGFDIEQGIKDDIIETEIDEEVSKEVKADVPFTEYVDEVSQYVVFKFKTKADWNYINNVLGLGKVKMFSTRKDGKKNGMMATGIGRVVDGMEAVKKIEDNYKMLFGGKMKGEAND